MDTAVPFSLTVSFSSASCLVFACLLSVHLLRFPLARTNCSLWIYVNGFGGSVFVWSAYVLFLFVSMH